MWFFFFPHLSLDAPWDLDIKSLLDYDDPEMTIMSMSHLQISFFEKGVSSQIELTEQGGEKG